MSLISVLLAVTFPIQSPPAKITELPVLAVARFYLPGKTPSKFGIYFMDPSGKQRIRVATSEEPNQAQFVGKRYVSFTTNSGLWLSEISNWKPRLIVKGPEIHFRESRWRISEPGDPEIELDYEQTEAYQIEPSTGKIYPSEVQKPAGWLEFGEEGIEIPQPDQPDRTLKLTQYQPLSYYDGSRSADVDSNPQWATQNPETKELLILAGSSSSSTGSINDLLSLKIGSRPRWIFKGANSFDFWEKRSAFAYCTTRDLVTFSTKPKLVQVWGSKLIIGNWKSGKTREILNGKVWVASVSLKPGISLL